MNKKARYPPDSDKFPGMGYCRNRTSRLPEPRNSAPNGRTRSVPQSKAKIRTLPNGGSPDLRVRRNHAKECSCTGVFCTLEILYGEATACVHAESSTGFDQNGYKNVLYITVIVPNYP